MTIYLASDHAGFELKGKIKEFLLERGYKVKDFGAFELNPDDDYPDFVHQAAKAVSKNHKDSLGIILGASGEGEAMVANRYRGVRAAVYYSSPAGARAKAGGDQIIRLSREHNNANVLSLGARFLTPKEGLSAVALWLKTPFSRKERHARRIEKIDRP